MAIGHLNWDQGLPDSEPEADEVALITRAKSGDGEAFTQLYLRYRPRVMRLALARLSDPRLAEEVVQETFLRALHRFDRIDPQRPLGPWLTTIAANLVVDSHRSRERTVPTEHADDILPRGGADPTADAVLAAEGVRNLRRAIEELPSRQRRILLGSTMLELSPAELAQRENVSEASVTSVVYRARLSVRRTLRRLATVLVVFRAARSRTREEVALITSEFTAAAEAGASSVVLSLSLLIGAAATGGVLPPEVAEPARVSTGAAPVALSPSHVRFFAPGRAAAAPVGDSPGGSPAPLRTSVQTEPPNDDGMTPRSGVVRVEVVGPDGETWHYNEVGVVCQDRVPDQTSGPLRVYC